ncbi:MULTISPECIES: ribonuclease P protein component [unclassified Bordetella]|uniref:ribonuclease P protein component n=1 Tax=unclassified Bordetella TaxID=2630031 RepID=UPI00132922ED|nr:MULTISPECIES: ribonuclease P protein component [unclassified Bordetella]MVW71527.1 ribonuclease P protein component [Bordetella sp. 15P40C-2]MVW78375.1 ribonuclease P protein component [Bordetella sp. 02P26C-1]
MPRATLPPEARLHRPSEFTAALKARRLARGAFFVLSAAAPGDAPTEQMPQARLGMVIAKRFAAHATTRNALKRVIREAFRHCRLQLPPQDYVVRLHSKVAPASLTALKRAARADADALFARAKPRGPKS